MGETLRVAQGATLVRQVEVQLEGTDDPVTGFTGSETLALQVWPGGSYPAWTLASSGLAWEDAANALATMTIHQADTAGWVVGPVRVQGFLTSAGRKVPMFLEPMLLWVDPAPGATTAPATYCGWSDLERYAPWMGDLITDDPAFAADFREACARARSTVDDAILAADDSQRRRKGGRNAFLTWTQAGDSEWLRDELAANHLMVTGTRGDRVREIGARLAIAYVCENQLGQGPGETPFQEIAAKYLRRAHELMATFTAELDTNADGEPDYRIYLGMRSSR
jgi:hypothetical protein